MDQSLIIARRISDSTAWRAMHHSTFTVQPMRTTRIPPGTGNWRMRPTWRTSRARRRTETLLLRVRIALVSLEPMATLYQHEAGCTQCLQNSLWSDACGMKEDKVVTPMDPRAACGEGSGEGNQGETRHEGVWKRRNPTRYHFNRPLLSGTDFPGHASRLLKRLRAWKWHRFRAVG